ncbi:hypothetical protein PRZ48_002409 [Zasmidium cellare]|uniref:Oxidoreductase n=1 Tax=Zasmidium cellare TaxID=395010 RepID=A0ABR0F4M8_ZASCE|nr:hypothetical protein PRZ48_002409 [Zasmidium cellare]
MAGPKVKRYVIVGMGVRSAFYYQTIIMDFREHAEVVGICDTNQTRMDAANDRMVEVGGSRVPTYKDSDFDRMVEEQKPDVVIVTTIDKFHHVYCIRAMELGCDAITEKPVTIDEEKLQAIIDTEKRTGRHVRVLFNYRYSPHHTKVRELIKSGVIGEVTSVHMDWILDCAHGSDFMRRWHREKANSGGIQMHKSIHHFDLVHFWLGTSPETVYCVGGLKFYGRQNAEQRGVKYTGERYLDNEEESAKDPFAISLKENRELKALYLDAEHEDGYIRDRNCFADGITIEDTLSMVVTYANGASMTYNTYAYAPWEGYHAVFNGTKGRMEVDLVEGGYAAGNNHDAITANSKGDKSKQGAVERTKITVQPLWAEPYEVPVQRGEGGHGGGDPILLRDVLITHDKPEDEFSRAAFLRDGGNAVLVGVGINHSMRTGLPVKVQELVKW